MLAGYRDCAAVGIIHGDELVVDVVLNCFLVVVMSKGMRFFSNVSDCAFSCMLGETDPRFLGVRMPSFGGGTGTRLPASTEDCKDVGGSIVGCST